MPKINKLSFTFFLLFTFFFINSCGKKADNSDKEYLSVVSTNPRNSQTNIKTDTKVVMVLNKSFGDIKQNTITDNTLTILDSDYNIVTGHISMVGNNLIFKSSQKLKANEKYTVTLGKNIKDLDGNTLKQDYIYSFTTKQDEVKQDETQQTPETNNQATTLEVTSTIPNNNAQNVEITTNITITFNESINSNSIGNNNLSLIDTQGNVINANTRVVGNRIILNPSSNLSYDTMYNLSVTKSIKAENGASLSSIYSFGFRTKKEIQDNENPSNNIVNIIGVNNVLFATGFSENTNISDLSSHNVNIVNENVEFNNQELEFDGDSYIDISSIANTLKNENGKFSISLFMKPSLYNQNNAHPTLFVYSEGTRCGQDFLIGSFNKDTKIVGDWISNRCNSEFRGNQIISSTLSSPHQKYYNIVYIYKNNSFEMFVDGVSAGNSAIDSLFDFNKLNKFYFGYDGVPGRYFSGQMKQLLITKGSLTQQQITNLYNNGEGVLYR